MAIIQNVCLSDFRAAFVRMDREEIFSWEGLEVLFYHMESFSEETREDWELDVIALCRDYHEYDLETINQEYDQEFETLDEAVEWLQDETIVCGTTSDTIIFLCFKRNNKMKTKKNVVLILSAARGKYIPRDFITDNYIELAIDHCAAWGLNETNWDNWIDASDPDSEFYWDAWEWILNNASYTEESTGKVFSLYQDGDLWGLCYDSMTQEERAQFGIEE